MLVNVLRKDLLYLQSLSFFTNKLLLFIHYFCLGCAYRMSEIKDFLKMLGEKLQPPDLEKIKYLLKDSLPGKIHNCILSSF